MKKILLLSLLFISFTATAFAADTQGTFIKVVENANGSFDEVSKSVESGLKTAGWDILASFDTGVPKDCGFRSRVIVFSSEDYASSIMGNGAKAAFALPLKAGIYEDETGINVNVINPASVNRTIIHETELDDFSISASGSLVDTIAKAVSGNSVKKHIGELRKTGRVGGMGGGNFRDKIEEIHSASDNTDATFSRITAEVEKGINNNTKGWKLAYIYDLPSHSVKIFGVTNQEMESRAFTIAGEKRSSGSNRFPGIDHGPAFPVEVILYREDGKIKVVTLDEMYRMKLYFEDAGMWAFMKNMTMPGTIESEIVEMSVSEITKK